MSTSRTLAIFVKVSMLGWLVLVHHLETVASSLPSCSANHLLVRFVSASTTLRRFMSLIIPYLYICGYKDKQFFPKIYEKQRKFGGKLPQPLRERISSLPNVEYLGFVDDPYLIIANAKAEIAPLHMGAGVKVKCIEAMACGTIVIGTEVAFEGIDEIYGNAMLKADTPEEYIKTMMNIRQSLEDKKRLKEFFIQNYNHKSVVAYILNT